ncbi:hypothetical protein L198_04188 [Cryptococcus wingfieldii CBS 7118]|uniref:F-box domain-containing protein n=1 Tax=Cryptococcus wingfieldii CBS 7118 TaxID=1295528 RepID=A0A1E3J6J3_9TREE|nr:hypothetical protein L198_04188 [Cryptococcus wingfieldii CBS 7118]ODN96474.1 hypothetical protein L198_04188 [Cryptococcus wingfieldii CBS 7118]
MLAHIPPEILSHIAFHLALASPDTLLATPNVPLLQTCRAVADTLAPSRNYRLYARIYRACFDTDAAERRMGSGYDAGPAGARYKKLTVDGGKKIQAQGMVAELQKRLGSLARLRRMVQQGDVRDVVDSDLWVLYFMLIENDGKNIDLLFGPTALVDLERFLELYHEQHLLEAAVAPGYPEETVGRSLAMWMIWFVAGSGPSDETEEQREERQFVLRPYVFAAPRYDAYFAPWTLPSLPISPESAALLSEDLGGSNPYVADLVPRSRLEVIQAYGRDVRICAPHISHAAIARFFYRRLGEEIEESKTNVVVAPFMSLLGEASRTASTSTTPAGPTPAGPTPTGPSPASTAPQTPLLAPFGAPSTRMPLLTSSAAHDAEFYRLSLCYDPTRTPGMPRPAWRGTFEGCWEGTFSFFDFEAFKEMLSGQARALYEGPYGEQAQVWKIKETWVRREGWVRKEAVDKGKGKAKAKGEEREVEEPQSPNTAVSGPMLNAGFPSDQVSPTFPSLAPFAAEQVTVQETIQQQLEAMNGYEQVPEHELDEMMGADDGGEEADLELLLTGVGHSAWGNFILKGRVRAWDGMASLVKEYAPDSRGKWIYRGYVMAGSIFVGRWRDTYTPESYVGYEGTFILNRR